MPKNVLDVAYRQLTEGIDRKNGECEESRRGRASGIGEDFRQIGGCEDGLSVLKACRGL